MTDAQSAQQTKAGSLAGRLARDEGGAILVIGIFMAIFLTAMLAYVAGIAQTTWYREQLQDAADGTAISAAIIHARGMNLIVLVNLIMEGLVMIILILQLLVTILAIVALILAACFLYPAAAAIAQIGYQVYEISEQVQDVVDEILPILHDLESVVRAVTPFIAETDAIVHSQEDYQVTSFGFLVPSRLTLPVEPGTYKKLCQRAGQDLIDTILKAIPGIPGMVRKQVAKIGGGIIGALSVWFCGDDSGGPSGFESGAPPPSSKRDYNLDYPNLPYRDACIEVNLTMKAPENKDEQPCQKYGEAVQERLPGSDHSCETARAQSGGSTSSECYSSAATARSDCNPLTHPNVGDYIYTVGTIEKTFVMTKGEWIEDKSLRRVMNTATVGERPVMTTSFEPTPANFDAVEFDADPESREKHGNPCGSSETRIWQSDPFNNFARGTVREDWNEQMFADPVSGAPNPNLVEPVCAEPMEALPAPNDRGVPVKDGTKVTRSVYAVTEVFFCAEQKSKEVPIVNWDTSKQGKQQNGEGNSEENDDDKSPYLVDKEVFLGDSDFQVRSVIIGRGTNIKYTAIDAARWGRDPKDKEQILQVLDYLNDIAVAQAEFYYEDGANSGVRDDWMWNMRWRGRLTRFRLPGSDDDTSSGEGGTGSSVGGSARGASAPSGGSGGQGSSGSKGQRSSASAPAGGGGSTNTTGQGAGGSPQLPFAPPKGSAKDCTQGPSLNCAAGFGDPAQMASDFGGIMKDQLMQQVKSSAVEACDAVMGAAGSSIDCGQIIQLVDGMGEMIGH